MKTIYCYARPVGREYGVAAVCEDGTLLASHVSSSLAWARHDIGHGPDSRANWYDTKYDAHCGHGNWRTVWVDEPDNCTALYEALERGGLLQGTGAGDGPEEEREGRQ